MILIRKKLGVIIEMEFLKNASLFVLSLKIVEVINEIISYMVYESCRG